MRGGESETMISPQTKQLDKQRKEGLAMGKFLFVLTRGLEDPTRVTRTFQLAKVAKEKGNEVNLFLTDDAVVLAKPGMVDHVAAPTGDEAATYFSYLVDNKVPIYV
jgi:predicted peroxiredoxin